MHHGKLLQKNKDIIKMNEIDKVKSIYTKLFKKNKHSYLSLNWGSVAGQELRFEILSQISNLNKKNILDVGCGLGDFYNFLIKNDKIINYTGVDITSDLIEAASEKYGKNLFSCDDFLLDTTYKKNSFDYVFASGIFATYTDNPIDIYRKFVTRMFDLCKKGIAFNSLSSWAKIKDGDEYYADPIEIITLCKTFTDKIIFRHDYHPRDFTIFLYKD